MLYLMCMWHGLRRIKADDNFHVFAFGFLFFFFFTFLCLGVVSGRTVLSLGRFLR